MQEAERLILRSEALNARVVGQCPEERTGTDVIMSVEPGITMNVLTESLIEFAGVNAIRARCLRNLIRAAKQFVAMAGKRSAPTREILAAQFLCNLLISEVSGKPGFMLGDDFIPRAIPSRNERIAPFRSAIAPLREPLLDQPTMFRVSETDDFWLFGLPGHDAASLTVLNAPTSHSGAIGGRGGDEERGRPMQGAPVGQHRRGRAVRAPEGSEGRNKKRRRPRAVRPRLPRSQASRSEAWQRQSWKEDRGSPGRVGKKEWRGLEKGKGGYVGVGSGMRKAATMRPKVATPTQVTGEG